MSMFRKKPVVEATAREALRDTCFPCATAGVPSVEVDYDASIWTRTPKPGEDRTEWVAQHAAAFAVDLGEPVASFQPLLQPAADRLVTHTVDLVAIPQDARKVRTMVLYVDVLDDELGMLEHGDPATFLLFGDVAPEARVQTRLFGFKRDPFVFTFSDLFDPTVEPGGLGHFLRAHRVVSPGVHLYAMGFFCAARNIEHMLRTINRVRP